MLIQEIRELTDQQLQEELSKSYQELMNLRFWAATNQLPDTNMPRSVRKSIARLQTIMRERQVVEGEHGQGHAQGPQRFRGAGGAGKNHGCGDGLETASSDLR